VAPRTPITAKLAADLYTAVGIDRVVSLDLHSGQIQGFFDIPFDNLFARPVLLNYIESHLKPKGDVVIVSPDAGGMERARAYAKKIDCPVAMIDKRRSGPNIAKAMNLVGDVKGAIALVVDDMIDTAGTLTEAADALINHGAKEVYACACHAVLSGPAVQRIRTSAIQKVIITDTIPLRGEALECDKFVVLSVAELLGEAIRRIHYHDSVSQLFD
jgi:ribose-phosphate pyrophosphokinase